MKKILFSLWLVFLPRLLWSQVISPPAGARPPDTLISVRKDTIFSTPVQQVDLSDELKAVFHKRRSEPNKKADSLILKPTFSGVPAIGYTLTTRLAGTLSGNMAFRTFPGAKLSTVTASAAYTENKQFTFPVESNIWTKDNKFNLLGDYRFYKYPQNTYGLGSRSDIENAEQLDYYFFRFSEIVQKKISGYFYGGIGYILEYQWNIKDQPPRASFVTDYQKYHTPAKTLASGFIINGLFDTRDNPINPSGGTYSSLQYRSNLTALASDKNWQSLIIDFRKYFHFPGKNRNILAFWCYDWLILSGKPPYLDLPSTSWDVYSNTGRGYIQGRFKGADMVYLETEYRFAITANGLVGGVVFLNGESFSAAPGTPLESIQPGFGAGVRIKLNKKSDTNLSIDYGFGTQGSKGLFINIGEMF